MKLISRSGGARGGGNVRRRGRTFIKFRLSVEQVIARMTRDNLIFDAKALILLK